MEKHTRKMMKKRYMKLIALLITAVMIFVLAACGGQQEVASEPDNSLEEAVSELNDLLEEVASELDDSSEEAASEKDDSEKNSALNPDGSSDVLVVYFSVTGNTRVVAEKIASVTGGDIYEIVPAVPYSDADLEYDDEARTSKEQNDPDCRPEIGSEDIDISSYNTIYIGYPIWYESEPRIVDTFVESHSFDGKTVITFCTSENSKIGTVLVRTKISLAEKAGSGDWESGRRFDVGVSEKGIENWLSERNMWE